MRPVRRASAVAATAMLNITPRPKPGPSCSHCQRHLVSHPAYIVCALASCNAAPICVDCFSVGAADTHPHEPSHPYRIIARSEPALYDTDWKPVDEMRLLEALLAHGPHHWNQVAELVGKLPRKCQLHYYRVYLDGADAPLPTSVLPSNAANQASADNASVTPGNTPKTLNSNFNSENAPSPSASPAPSDDDSDVVLNPNFGNSSKLDGYMPLRSDLDVEYDDNAEDLIADLAIADSDTEEEKDLKLRLLSMYDKRLRKREEVKKFMLDRNLLDFSKLKVGDRRTRNDEKELLARLQIFRRHMSPADFNALRDGSMRDFRISRDIHRIQQCRAVGMKRRAEVDVYDVERKARVARLANAAAGGDGDAMANMTVPIGSTTTAADPALTASPQLRKKRRVSAAKRRRPPPPTLEKFSSAVPSTPANAAIVLTFPDAGADQVAATVIDTASAVPHGISKIGAMSAVAVATTEAAASVVSTGSALAVSTSSKGIVHGNDDGGNSMCVDLTHLPRAPHATTTGVDTNVVAVDDATVTPAASPPPTIDLDADCIDGCEGSPLGAVAVRRGPSDPLSTWKTRRLEKSPYPQLEAMPVDRLPDYWKLTPAERKVCSMLHISPSEFIQRRDAMLHTATLEFQNEVDAKSHDKLGSMLTLRCRKVAAQQASTREIGDVVGVGSSGAVGNEVVIPAGAFDGSVMSRGHGQTCRLPDHVIARTARVLIARSGAGEGLMHNTSTSDFLNISGACKDSNQVYSGHTTGAISTVKHVVDTEVNNGETAYAVDESSRGDSVGAVAKMMRRRVSVLIDATGDPLSNMVEAAGNAVEETEREISLSMRSTANVAGRKHVGTQTCHDAEVNLVADGERDGYEGFPMQRECAGDVAMAGYDGRESGSARAFADLSDDIPLMVEVHTKAIGNATAGSADSTGQQVRDVIGAVIGACVVGDDSGARGGAETHGDDGITENGNEFVVLSKWKKTNGAVDDERMALHEHERMVKGVTRVATCGRDRIMRSDYLWERRVRVEALEIEQPVVEMEEVKEVKVEKQEEVAVKVVRKAPGRRTGSRGSRGGGRGGRGGRSHLRASGGISKRGRPTKRVVIEDDDDDDVIVFSKVERGSRMRGGCAVKVEGQLRALKKSNDHDELVLDSSDGGDGGDMSGKAAGPCGVIDVDGKPRLLLRLRVRNSNSLQKSVGASPGRGATPRRGVSPRRGTSPKRGASSRRASSTRGSGASTRGGSTRGGASPKGGGVARNSGPVRTGGWRGGPIRGRKRGRGRQRKVISASEHVGDIMEEKGYQVEGMQMDSAMEGSDLGKKHRDMGGRVVDVFGNPVVIDDKEVEIVEIKDDMTRRESIADDNEVCAKSKHFSMIGKEVSAVNKESHVVDRDGGNETKIVVKEGSTADNDVNMVDDEVVVGKSLDEIMDGAHGHVNSNGAIVQQAVDSEEEEIEVMDMNVEVVSPTKASDLRGESDDEDDDEDDEDDEEILDEGKEGEGDYIPTSPENDMDDDALDIVKLSDSSRRRGRRGRGVSRKSGRITKRCRGGARVAGVSADGGGAVTRRGGRRGAFGRLGSVDSSAVEIEEGILWLEPAGNVRGGRGRGGLAGGKKGGGAADSRRGGGSAGRGRVTTRSNVERYSLRKKKGD